MNDEQFRTILECHERLAKLCDELIEQRNSVRAEIARLNAVIAERDQTIEDLALGSGLTDNPQARP